MWKTSAAIVGSLILLGSFGHAEALPQAVSPTATPTASPTVIASGALSAAFVTGAHRSISAELAILDGGALTQSLSQAARTGLSVRLLLDPSQRGSRLQGRALNEAFRPLSPGAQPAVDLRWASGTGRPERRILVDDEELLRWGQGQIPFRDDLGAAAFKHRFESRWAQALTGLAEAQALEDELRSLPDPRDKEPRISRRKDPSAPSAGSGQAQDTEGTP